MIKKQCMNNGKQIFISYAREDEGSARKVYEDLSAKGFKVWFDKETLLPGQNWELEIKKGIREADAIIILISSKSVNKRGYINKEIRLALDEALSFPEGAIFVIPVLLEDCKPNFEQLRELHWLNFFPSYENGMERLLKSLALL